MLKSQFIEKISQKQLLLYIAVAMAVFFLYNVISQLWFSQNAWAFRQFYCEYPFFLLLLLCLYFPQIKNKLIKYIFPLLPVLVAYVLFDAFYLYLRRVPRISDIKNIPLLFDFSPGMGMLLISIMAIIPVAVITVLYHALRNYSRRKFLLLSAAKISFLLCLVSFISSEAFTWYQKKTFRDLAWSQDRTIRHNGRIAYFLFQHKRARHNYHLLRSYPDQGMDISVTLFPGEITRERNIHLVVLESFVDPRLFRKMHFDPSPLADELRPYLKAGQFSLPISPSYGGSTPQAEFEVLTGVKAMQRMGTSEFNVMDGGRINAFVARLKQQGYQASATIAPGKEYYNTVLAYESLGFAEVEFLQDDKSFPETPGDHRIFDGDVFDYNLAKLKTRTEKGEGPVLNFILGMYAHYPYRRNKKLRPDLIEVRPNIDKAERIVNQFYYRTRALGNYITNLLEADPDCLICVVSDHLPPVVTDFWRYDYQADKQVNIAMMLNGSEIVDISGLRYYEIPWLIWDLLAGQLRSREISPEDMEKFYFETMRSSVNLQGK